MFSSLISKVGAAGASPRALRRAGASVGVSVRSGASQTRLFLTTAAAAAGFRGLPAAAGLLAIGVSAYCSTSPAETEAEAGDVGGVDPFADTKLYPKSAPHRAGQLAVSDLHTIHYEVYGNPSGKPVLFVHGGPGGGTTPAHARFFDPAAYRIILVHQRGCGKSTPFAELRENTTQDSIADFEKLRKHLDVDKWQVFGGSWGSTLALAYAVSGQEEEFMNYIYELYSTIQYNTIQYYAIGDDRHR
jgi:hypothetical protein